MTTTAPHDGRLQAAAVPGGGPATIDRLLDLALSESPETEALVGRHGRYSYLQLDEAVRRAAAALARRGVSEGDRVAASLGNHPEIVITFLAAMRLGAIWVGVNRRLAPPEKQYLLADAGASLFLGDVETVTEIRRQISTLPDLRTTITVEPDVDGEWGSLLADADGDPPVTTIDPHAPAAIAYTSGTTGFPKGAVHSQHNMLLPGNLRSLGAVSSSGARYGVALPLTVLNLMILGPLAVYQSGGCLVTMDRVDPVGLAEWVRTERIVTFAAVPTMLHDLLTSPDVDPQDLAPLQRPGVGGADCPESLKDLYRQRFGTRVTTAYGLTEAPTAVTFEDPTAPPVPGSCGRALPHVEIRILDDAGTALPAGELGEICIAPATSGPLANTYTPMLGYWNNPAATETALRDGVLHTGDVGSLDHDSNLFIKDRRTELIIRGGSNVYPAEVERVLLDHDDVRGCGVVGRPDPRLGEEVVAYVELTHDAVSTEADLRTHCSTNLARDKVPTQFVILDALPRTAMGKVAKAELRKTVDSGGSQA